MPITTYTSADLGNIVALLGPTLTNCVDTGSAPLNPNFSGSFSDVAFLKTAGASYSNGCGASGAWTADIDHGSVINPIHPNAHIRRVTMRMRFIANAQQASIDAVFTNGDFTFLSQTIAGSSVVVQVYPQPINSQWASVSEIINSNDQEIVLGFNSSASALVSPQGSLTRQVYDFTVNPNGDFPLRYMDYATFLTNFSQTFIGLVTVSNAQADWVGFTQPPTAEINGTATGNCFLQATQWTMEVEWELPSSWTLETPVITLPDNLIVISRPEPVGEGEGEDTEQVESIQIGNTKIEPNDPWVIIWTKFIIKLHLPVEENYGDDPEVILNFVGTEFSGAISALPITIIYADLSGLYVLDDSIHHDVLYERTEIPTTQNVLIPAPFFVTHFVDTPETDISHYAGTRIGMTGQGTIKQIFQSADYINTLQFGNVILRTSNNRSPFSLANFTDQHAALRVYMDQLDDYMRVDKIVIFAKPVFTGYPQ